MQRVRTRPTVSVKPSGRVATARRLEAARVLAGRPSLRALAAQTGMSYPHLVGVAGGREPLTTTDCRDLAAALGVPSEWLRDGWTTTYAAS